MTDYIGEKIRDLVLSELPWISRAAGYTEPVPNADGGYFPGARPFPGQPYHGVSDYVNMAPQETETAISFVDWDGDLRRVYQNAKLYDFETFFRVVVWFDERKISVDAGNVMFAMQGAIAAGIRAISLNTDGLLRTKTFFDSATFDAAKVWDRYKMPEKQGLFMLPYRTFALRFRLIGRMVPGCFTGQITTDASAC